MSSKNLTITLLLLYVACSLKAQNSLDSIQHLDEVIVTAKRFKEVIPAQKLSKEELQALNSFSVADAIRYFSGIQVKDYGGVGGLKTINIRSMGTHHVGIFYDGIQLGNAQNGQIDLGKFSLENMEEISLYNGQKSEIFQPAKDFGTSGSVYLRTRTPKFKEGQRFHFKARIKGGSFDLINPSFLYESRLNNRISASLNAEVINSSGKYKFRYKRVYPNTNQCMYDTTATRKNGDIYSLRLETGLYGNITDGFWRIKAYFYHSNRGIPGAIVNNRWLNSQRQTDKNFFLQGSIQKSLGKRWDMQFKAKYAYDYMNYVNPDTTLMLIDNTFKQQEGYFSLSGKYSITSYWDVSLASDIQYNTLHSDMDGFVYPQRLTSLTAAATAIEWGKLKIQASILATLVKERIHSGNTAQDDSVKAAPNKHEFTPAVFLSYKPFSRHHLNFRAFYKRIFRMPTFNDLYYTDIGNVALKPEYTNQYNLGFQYDKYFTKSLIRQFSIQADAYYNEVTDKIVAVPKGSGQYRWMMMNLGYVEIRGIDASSSIIAALPLGIQLNLKLSYTYQKAQDFTHRSSEILENLTYGGQIPYIPWHSGSVISSLTYKTWQLNYSFIYVGERYHSSANIREDYEQPWYTHDMAVIKNFNLKKCNMRLSAEINNLFSQDYEVVLNYPMPKRNYKLTFSIEI